MSNETTSGTEQRVTEIVVNRNRQSLYPFVITFTQSEQSSDEREEQQYDFIEGEFTLR
jgi:hypothetical protein